MSLTGFINVTPAANQIFTNAGLNDMVIYTQSNSQKLILGVNSNSVGQITISSNLTTINGGLLLSSPISMTGLTISGTSSGQPVNSFTTYITQIAGYSNFSNSNIYFVSSNNSNTNFVFMGGSNTVATLTGSGQLGIGSSNLPAYPLDVTGSARITGSLYNPNKPYVYVRDRTQYGTSTTNTFTVGQVILNTGAMYNSSYTQRIYFPVNGIYCVQAYYHWAPLTTTTNMQIVVSINLAGFPADSSPINVYQNGGGTIGTSTISTGGNGDQYANGSWTGYAPAGAYFSITSYCNYNALCNYNGQWNYIVAYLQQAL